MLGIVIPCICADTKKEERIDIDLHTPFSKVYSFLHNCGKSDNLGSSEKSKKYRDLKRLHNDGDNVRKTYMV